MDKIKQFLSFIWECCALSKIGDFFDDDAHKIVSSRGEKILSDDSIDLDKFVEENKEI